MITSRRVLLLAGAGLAMGCGEAANLADSNAEDGARAANGGTAADIPPVDIEIAETSVQGGGLVGRTRPGARITFDNKTFSADGEGRFVIAFPENAGETAEIRIEPRENVTPLTRTIRVERRTFPTQSITVTRGDDPGLPIDWFDLENPEQDGRRRGGLTPAEQARVNREGALKSAAFAAETAAAGYAQAWAPPLTGQITSQWGARRRITSPSGTQVKTHYGVDIAAPRGDAISAPASGVVVLAEPDMFYEGGCVFLDHGQGLKTVYLHMDTLAVEVGTALNAGDLIGTVGSKGRATGPHLCWRMKWRDRQVDPTLWVGGASAISAR